MEWQLVSKFVVINILTAAEDIVGGYGLWNAGEGWKAIVRILQKLGFYRRLAEQCLLRRYVL